MVTVTVTDSEAKATKLGRKKVRSNIALLTRNSEDWHTITAVRTL